MDTSQTTLFILSAERPELSDEDNAARTSELDKQLSALVMPVVAVPAKGVWNGQSEANFMARVPSGDDAAISLLRNLARSYGQDAVLEVQGRHAWIVFLNSQNGDVTEYAGRWRKSSKDEVEVKGLDYTYIPALDEYYTIFKA
ncbi:MAG: DUF3293 domain-containing protein [Nitrososphaera sp.]|nr:DUF3293 domain-containing protein [Nitrososphaera sp.]